MARQQRGSRVLGPYRHGQRWRIRLVDERGQATVESYETEEQAKQVIRSIRRELAKSGPTTVDEAMTAYASYMKTDKGNRPTSVATTIARLESFFVDLEQPVGALTRASCERMYVDLTRRPTRQNKPASVDTHRNTLAEAKTFLRWCVKRKYLASSPLEAVDGVGKRRHGKPQLRVDESRTWLAKALQLADSGDVGAIMAMVALLMGLRASEITNRVVRDLDDDGRLLWVTKAKTSHGVRKQAVPEVLRPYLLRLAEGKSPEARLFGEHWRDYVRKSVRRVCRLAGVPEITAHGMRGTHSTLAVEAGSTGNVVAASLGHGSATVTFTSYVAPGTKESVASRRAFEVLQGGRAESGQPLGSIGPRIDPNAGAENINGQNLNDSGRFRGAVGDRTPDL